MPRTEPTKKFFLTMTALTAVEQDGDTAGVVSRSPPD